MTPCDVGPLVSLINRGDAQHSRCASALAMLSSPLLTTWPCYTEAMYLLGQMGGYSSQVLLWRYIDNGYLKIRANAPEEITRMEALMSLYRDTPMDLADASLVATAEALNLRRIFSLDSDFYVYRFRGTEAFEVFLGKIER